MRPRLILAGLGAAVSGGVGGVYAYAAALGNAYAAFGGQGGPSNDGLGVVIVICLAIACIGLALFFGGLCLPSLRDPQGGGGK